jgi:hypothetical protein
MRGYIANLMNNPANTAPAQLADLAQMRRAALPEF